MAFFIACTLKGFTTTASFVQTTTTTTTMTFVQTTRTLSSRTCIDQFIDDFMAREKETQERNIIPSLFLTFMSTYR